MTDSFLLKETGNLIKQWESYDQSTLLEYLVQGFQDPRINTQSILARHYIGQFIYGDKFKELEIDELKWSIEANKLLNDYQKKNKVSIHKLSGKNDEPEKLLYKDVFNKYFESEYKIIEQRWCECLKEYGSSLDKPTVIEAACGSANDFRFLESYGFSDAILYKGFDLNETNVKNSKGLYPYIEFDRGNILDIDEKNKSWDIMIIHDLFEHLHIDAYHIAMKEAARVTKGKIIISYFNMEEIEEHVVRPVKFYHWNCLSRNKTVAEWEGLGGKVTVININKLTTEYDFSEFHNKKAYTFLVEF